LDTTIEGQTTDLMSVVEEICGEIASRTDRAAVAEAGRSKEIPAKLFELCGTTGLLGVGLPEEYGGVGGGVTESIYALELLHASGLQLPLMTPNTMSRVSVLKHGTEEQKREFLPPTTTGEGHFSFAITEPEAGTNTFKIRTNAVKHDDGSFLLNGGKHYITSFVESTACIVVARTAPHDPSNRTAGLTLFIIDPNWPGITATPMSIALYMPSKSYVVHFDDVRIPPGRILGTEGKGLAALFDCLNPERLVASAQNIGMATFVLNKAAEYARQRAPFDRPIGSYQSVQHPLAIAKTFAAGARALTYQAARSYDAGELPSLDTNMAKYLSSRAYSEAANAATNAFGGSFADIDQDIIPFFLQSKLNEIVPINNNVVLSYIGERGLGLPKSY